VQVVIAEDLFLLRDGLIRLLEAYGFEVSAAVDNGEDFLAAVRSHRPDIAVVDVRLQARRQGDRLIPGGGLVDHFGIANAAQQPAQALPELRAVIGD